jgi:hypothetical protein
VGALGWLAGSGFARRAELTDGGNGAVAGNRNPASGWNGQGNTGRASSLDAGGSFRCAWDTGVVRRSELTGTAPMADGGGSALTRVKEGLLWPARGG